MGKLSFLQCIVISIFLHILAFFLISLDFSSVRDFQPNLKSGVVVNTNLVFLRTKNFSRAKESNSVTKESKQEGTLTQEISRFQNSLSYPSLALERGWETECEWEVEISAGKIISWRYLKPCSHEIFQKAVEKSFLTWEFSTTTFQKVNIPIRFQIQEKN